MVRILSNTKQSKKLNWCRACKSATSAIFLISHNSLSGSASAFTHRPLFNNALPAFKPFIEQSKLDIYTKSNTVLSMREKMNWFDDKEESQRNGVRFLGKGENAIIRPGVVLIAPRHEYHHFLMKAAVFIYAIGINDYGEHVTRGVIIDHPTAFTMGEMSAGSVVGVLGNNILFQGGEQGNDSAIMLHSLGNKDIGEGKMIGTSGVYEGGLNAALEAADEGNADPDKFKFFFNYMEFTDAELNSMIRDEDSEGDAWIAVEAPVDMILDSNLDRGDAWRSLRNQLKQII